VECPAGTPPFLNAVVGLVPRAGETPEIFLAQLQRMERAFGRQPKKMLNEARALDLDLIVFGNQERTTMELTLPHPRALERAFVLVPLAEIAPGGRILGVRIKDALAKIDQTGIEKLPPR